MRPFAPALLLVAVALGACSSDDVCVQIDESCTPQYEPTFDNIFANTIAPNCAPPGTACHSVEGARGGLIMVDPDQTYGLYTGSRVVVGGDASCSPITARISSTRASFQMPPGAPLDEGEICAIEKWIAAGAQR